MTTASFSLGKTITRRAAIAATAAVIGASALSNFPAAAQQASLSPDQCRNAIIIGDAIKQKYNGQISRKLIDSFAKFRDTDCDLNTDFIRVNGTADEKAFGEFRVRLIAMRTSPASLTKN